jgi:hypothetical protein
LSQHSGDGLSHQCHHAFFLFAAQPRLQQLFCMRLQHRKQADIGIGQRPVENLRIEAGVIFRLVETDRAR